MILVTGGTGFLGSHLIYELLRRGEVIRATYRKNSDFNRVKKIFSFYCEEPEQLVKKIEWVEADTTNEYDINKVIIGIEKVYHAAGMVSFNRSDRYKLLKTNVIGTTNMVDACIENKVKKLCFVSSIATLGSAPDSEHTTEDLLWTDAREKSVYSLSKYKSEMEVWRAVEEGLKAVIINPSVIIGPADWRHSNTRIFKIIWNGLKYYSEGVTGFVDVRDVVKAMITLMDGDYSGERFIVTSENLSYRELFEMIAVSLGKKPPSRSITRWMLYLACGFDRMRSLLTRIPVSITRETVRFALEKTFLSNEKIIKVIGMKFIPVKTSVEETARFFLKDMHQKQDQSFKSTSAFDRIEYTHQTHSHPRGKRKPGN